MKREHVFVNKSTVTLNEKDSNDILVLVLPSNFVKQYSIKNSIDFKDWTENENYTCNDTMNLFQEVIENNIEYEIKEFIV